jgi:cytochrome c5
MKKTILPVTILPLLLSACAPAQPSKAVAHKPDFQHGSRVYLAHCGECHDSGRLGAPTLDDVENWDERSLPWKSVLTDHAGKGFLRMPAKGGKPGLTERDIADAVYYMDIKVKANED